ncbi:hypothetical protein [Thermogutta sp.]|uniref:hypothetical protein n=1 Tax=Thermogutta sp. TaxID=1962930 RepID=UPI003C7BAD77
MVDETREKDVSTQPGCGIRPPGTCIPWEEKRREMGEIKGNEALVKRIWENIDALGYMYIWQVLLSF